ncbi:MAG: hypothetical protein ACREBD_26035 [Blastocatellia bacterium]
MLQSIAAILAGLLAVDSYSTHPQRSLIVGIFYFIVVLVLFIVTIHSRAARDQVQAEVVWGLFSLINTEIFHDDPRTRFTLFRRSPFRPKYIVPWYRYYKGASDPISEAALSRARYKRNEGLTGKAWDQAGQRLLFLPLPEFHSRNEFVTHFVDTLGVEKDTVGDISEYMERVRAIFCYGFLWRDRLLGVLSLDVQVPLTQLPDGQIALPSPDDNHQVILDRNRLELLLRSMQNVLESFEQSQRR